MSACGRDVTALKNAHLAVFLYNSSLFVSVVLRLVLTTAMVIKVHSIAMILIMMMMVVMIEYTGWCNMSCI